MERRSGKTFHAWFPIDNFCNKKINQFDWMSGFFGKNKSYQLIWLGSHDSFLPKVRVEWENRLINTNAHQKLHRLMNCIDTSLKRYKNSIYLQIYRKNSNLTVCLLDSKVFRLERHFIAFSVHRNRHVKNIYSDSTV